MTKTDTLTFEAAQNYFRGGSRYLNISSEGADENELYPFLFDQFHCGKNERMNYAARSKLINLYRVGNGVNSTVEQAPYMARLRYVSRDIIRRLETTKLILLSILWKLRRVFHNLKISVKESIPAVGKVFISVVPPYYRLAGQSLLLIVISIRRRLMMLSASRLQSESP